MPTERKASRAACWCSVSMSTLVRIPSGCMPANRASPETPDPVPISTTALACTTRARKVRALAAPRPSGETPNSTAVSRAAKAASDSATKSSAYAQDAGLGADLGEVWPATRFTRVSVAKAPGQTEPDRTRATLRWRAMTHTVVAELVAAVLKVEVEVGQQVAPTDPVVILESMKMEIPVLAEVAGSVVEIVVVDGDVVSDGDPARGDPAATLNAEVYNLNRPGQGIYKKNRGVLFTS